jgi:transposase
VVSKIWGTDQIAVGTKVSDMQKNVARLFSASREGGALTEAAYWAHARRKIHDVYIRSQSATAEDALKHIGELYAIEVEIRDLPATKRLTARQSRSASLHEWMVEKRATLLKHPGGARRSLCTKPVKHPVLLLP